MPNHVLVDRFTLVPLQKENDILVYHNEEGVQFQLL